jgi:hypothetical protein
VSPFWVAADVLRRDFALGNGHLIQRIQRAFGLEPELVPRGCIHCAPVSSGKPTVALHFYPGPHAHRQRIQYHPRAREIYPETFSVIRQFVKLRNDLQFIEVGHQSSGVENVADCTRIPLDETIRHLANCDFFLGIMSGPLHIAAALGLKLITIVNFPRAEEICLPTLKDVDIVETEWFYPQSVILHQESDGGFARRLTLESLSRAVDGDVYPYWSPRYLDMIHD